MATTVQASNEEGRHNMLNLFELSSSVLPMVGNAENSEINHGKTVGEVHKTGADYGDELSFINKVINLELSRQEYNEALAPLSPFPTPDGGDGRGVGVGYTAIEKSAILETNSSFNLLLSDLHTPITDYSGFCSVLYNEQQEKLLDIHKQADLQQKVNISNQQQIWKLSEGQKQLLKYIRRGLPLPPPSRPQTALQSRPQSRSDSHMILHPQPQYIQHPQYNSRPPSQNYYPLAPSQFNSRPSSQQQFALPPPPPPSYTLRPQSSLHHFPTPVQQQQFPTPPYHFEARPQTQHQCQHHLVPHYHHIAPPPLAPAPFHPQQSPYYLPPQLFPSSSKEKNNFILSPAIIFVPSGSRFFVIKSFNEQDIISSFVHKVWSSTDLGNNRLSKAYYSLKNSSQRIFLLFSVNGSGQFCGIAEMKSNIFKNNTPTGAGEDNIWLDNSRWKGKFQIQWLVIKDVSNNYFRHLKFSFHSWNDQYELKPVTHSRDTQELPFKVGRQMIQIFKDVDSQTSFLQKMFLKQ